MASEAIGVALLSEHELERLASQHPEIREGESALVISAPRALLSAIEELAERLAWESTQEDRVLQALVEDVGSRVLGQARVLQLHRQAQAREQFLRDYETLSSADISGLSASAARNTAALANRWKSEGKIFAVSVGRMDRFPAFQFGDDGKPLPAVAEVIRIFERQSEWALALWFAAPSGWLNARTPAEVLISDPAAVVQAARRATEPLAV